MPARIAYILRSQLQSWLWKIPAMNGRKAATAAKFRLICLLHTIPRYLKVSVYGSCVPSKKRLLGANQGSFPLFNVGIVCVVLYTFVLFLFCHKCLDFTRLFCPFHICPLIINFISQTDSLEFCFASMDADSNERLAMQHQPQDFWNSWM
jgi:hypothetical protein